MNKRQHAIGLAWQYSDLLAFTAGLDTNADTRTEIAEPVNAIVDAAKEEIAAEARAPAQGKEER